MVNVTTVTRFLLLGFLKVRELQLVHSTLFLMVCLAALTGNLLTVTITVLDQRLHTHMYFFLRNLSFIDVCYISITVPKSTLNSLTNVNSNLLLACTAHVFLAISLAGSEMALLTVILIAVLYTASTLFLSFCGPTDVHQFFCDGPQLLRLTCSASHIAEHVRLVIAICLSFLHFVLIVISYLCIFRAMLSFQLTGSWEVSGSREALGQLRELCCLWLRPELELLVLGQFLTILSTDTQA
ncbi:olfactory receptor 14A16-like [Tachyglossus aculeatus]|uniref:olfactory receptor 14A16-like n=1 Tax=Tachyglossus aculeatus TaxID=9261 RepID=UPI0018F6C3CA|nr:olfactory receptor 14A16-like [Tachyglossus aculeatus]